MKRDFEFLITEEDLTIEQYLKRKGFSHSNIIALKKIPESILLNGRWEYVTKKLCAGDILTVHLTETESSKKILPVYAPLNIIYEDEDILILNKPANMPVHPSMNHYEHTLANAVAYYYASRNIPYVFRCINRLDRDTTGLTLLAKHMVSGAILSRMAAERKLKRNYLAIASGQFSEPFGTVNAPIARATDSSIERVIDFDHGEHAVTHYQVLCQQTEYALLKLSLETGRTHQIRVHMKHLGHPLLGDFLYHPDFSKISRQALHSYSLSFSHPITGKALHFTAPLPPDMQCLFPDISK
ncbi:MAG: RluA family pseudouridine synthase [Clostridiales bacterium]|nr:RluA family pseudouridine synthase [Clostridiales bacterium]